MGLWGIDMQVTDEMVMAAIGQYESYTQEMSCYNGMKAALEAAIQAAWVKFDINDETTYPPEDKFVLSNIGVVDFKYKTYGLAEPSCGYIYTPEDDDILSLKAWMPLPEFKE
jgi:hypothetical protein